MDGWLRLTGRLDRSEVREVLAAADIFLAPAARESFDVALRLQEAMVRAHPEAAAFRSKLVGLIHYLGMVDLRSGEAGAALRHFERARELQEGLHRSQPDDPGVLGELGGILNDQGIAHVRGGSS